MCQIAFNIPNRLMTEAGMDDRDKVLPGGWLHAQPTEKEEKQGSSAE